MKYNARKYNAQRYNIDGVYYASSLTETVTGVDVEYSDAVKILLDSLASADTTLAIMYGLNPVDFLFSDDLIQIQFTNKALSDTVRLADWLSIERSPARNEWYD